MSATSLAPVSVGTAALIDRSVIGAKLALGAVGPDNLAPGAVGTPALIDGSVTSAKLALGAVTFGKIAAGAIGPAALGVGSVEHDAVAHRAIGGLALRDAFPIADGRVDVAPGETEQVNATCPAGTRVLSGGFEWASGDKNGASVISSSPHVHRESRRDVDGAGQGRHRGAGKRAHRRSTLHQRLGTTPGGACAAGRSLAPDRAGGPPGLGAVRSVSGEPVWAVDPSGPGRST